MKSGRSDHASRKRVATGAVLPPASAAILVLLLTANVSAQSLKLDVALDQTTTVVGQSMSLKTVVEDLCWRAGAQLRSYDAQDRPFAAQISGKPLAQALSELLREESFMIGSWKGPAGSQIVTWVRVLGDHETARHHRESGPWPQHRSGMQLPPILVQGAFGSSDPSERARALEMLAQRIESDPAERQAFLDTEIELIAKALSRYPDARSMLESLQERQTDPSLQKKLSDLLAALATN